MDLNFIWEAFLILFVGFCLLRIAGKKAAEEMTGLEIITLLAMASMIGHAVAENDLWKTILILCLFVTMLITVQFLAVKFDTVEKWFIGKATLVIKDGQVIPENLKKMRMTVDQLEVKLRVKGVQSIADVKTATIEVNGQIGYELMRHARPVTIGEMEKMLAAPPFMAQAPQQQKQQQEQGQSGNIFKEVVYQQHEHPVSPELD
ncbi:DUF421 domain-containing protein [Paenibacillus sp. P26]|nr:DUF421 domain-containing protein [Paenibacillus sp. P26]